MVLRLFCWVGDFLDRFAKVFSCLCLSLMAIIMISEVIWRNIFMSITWSEEVAATFLGTWFIFIGASVPLKMGQLVSIQMLLSVLPKRVAAFVILLGQLMILIFLLVAIKFGFDLVELTLIQPSPVLMLPMAYAYLAIPIGSILMFYQTSVLMLQETCTMLFTAIGRPSAGVKSVKEENP